MIDPYYESLRLCGERYAEMSPDLDVHDFVREFRQGVEDRLPLMKLNRWLGYIQAMVIVAGKTTVEAERDWTRPLFRPLDFK